MSENMADLLGKLEKISRIPKCTGCSCLMDTLKEYEELVGKLPVEEAKALQDKIRELVGKTTVAHGCLGCNPCYPVQISNALYEMNLAGASEKRVCEPSCCEEGRVFGSGDSGEALWPVEPGEYLVGKRNSHLAVSTLASPDLAEPIAKAVSFTHVAIVGKTETENIGVEKVVKNIVSNPSIRFLILCGRESSGSNGIGHYSGQTLLALYRNGIAADRRVTGSLGRRPYVKNLSPEQVEQFRCQVSLLNLIGCEDPDTIRKEAGRLLESRPEPYSISQIYSAIPRIQAEHPKKLVLDKTGFLIVYIDPGAGKIIVEHYEYGGKLIQVMEGKDAASLYSAAIFSGMVSTLDHAAYLGREIAKAESALVRKEPYIQDRAPGEREDNKP